MAKTLAIGGMLIGALGIFFGFYFLADSPSTSLAIVTLTTVGIVGVLGFIRHFFFYKEDARRLGWETEHPDWIFEVGFANLGFGAVGLISVLAGWAPQAQAAALLGYALYLLQAGMLHGYRYFTDPVKDAGRLWRSCIATLLFALMMGFFAVTALVA